MVINAQPWSVGEIDRRGKRQGRLATLVSFSTIQVTSGHYYMCTMMAVTTHGMPSVQPVVQPSGSSLSFLLNPPAAVHVKKEDGHRLIRRSSESGDDGKAAVGEADSARGTATGSATTARSTNEVELLRRFLSLQMVNVALQKPGSRRGKHRRPSTMESLLRRWFAGRQTTAAAAGRAEALRGLLHDVANQQELM